MEAMIDNTIERAITDAGHRGYNAPPDYELKVYTAGQKRRVTPQIKRDMKWRAAVEPVIGHLKAEHRMGRNNPFAGLSVFVLRWALHGAIRARPAAVPAADG